MNEKSSIGWEMPKVNQSLPAGEVVLVSGTVVVVAAALFEWVVITPDHPGHALLRVLCAGLAATLALLPFRRQQG